MKFTWQGPLVKLKANLFDHKVNYFLGETELNQFVGSNITLTFLNKINCQHCDQLIKKTFGDGFCFKCFQKLPACDICIIKPELCHYDQGTCRDEQWGQTHCFQDHYVYLSFTSGTKVGITRATQIPTRWIDQGAIKALPIFKVANRKISGEIEKLITEKMNDKTNWRKMLLTEKTDESLIHQRDLIFDELGEHMDFILDQYGDDVELLEDEEIVRLDFPIQNYPEKITSTNFDKVKSISGVLLGIKGQYLISEQWVINLRRHTGYSVQIEVE